MASVKRSMGLIEWLSIIVLAIIWGGSYFFIGIAVKELPPFTIVALRVCLAALTLNIIIRCMGHAMPKKRKVWLAFCGMGLLNNMLPFCLIVWGQTHIASGLASILNATTPFFAVVAAHFLTKDEKMTRNRLLGVLIGIAGVLLMVGPEALHGIGKNLLAQFAVLGAAISYALAGIFGRRFQRMGITPVVTATGQVTASAVLFTMPAMVIDRPWQLAMPSWEALGAILALALFSTVCAYILYFRILSTAGATNVLLVTLLIPVSAVLLGTTILGEQLEAKHFFGMGVIGLGLLAIDGRVLGYFRRRCVTNPVEVSSR